MRLTWLAGESVLTQPETKKEGKSFARKRQRTKQLAGSSSSSSLSTNSTMWVDKYSPVSSAELSVAPKKVKEVKAWLEQSFETRSRNKLLVLVGSPGIGKSTMIRVLAKELNLAVCDWNESSNPRTGGDARAGLMSVEETSPIDSFQEFLQQTGSGFCSLQITTTSLANTPHSSFSQKCLILLEYLPNLHTVDQELQFRKIMTDHLHRSQVPTVLVFSDVTEGKHRPADLERLIEPQILYSSLATILQIHAATTPKMKKILEKIATFEGHSLPASFWEQIHESSRGDVRHAILTLQLALSGRQSLTTSRLPQNDRDVKPTTFHALGKLLYAKRIVENGKSTLAFNPEQVMERSDLGLGMSLGFLQSHCVDFFNDICELSDTMDYYSDAALLLDHTMEVRAL